MRRIACHPLTRVQSPVDLAAFLSSLMGVEAVARQLAFPVLHQTDEQGVVLKAELPGVSEDRLTLTLDQRRLTVEARRLPLEAAAEEVVLTRAFDLSERIDESQIGAELKDGILTLRLPYKPVADTRRVIPVNTPVTPESPSPTAEAA